LPILNLRIKGIEEREAQAIHAQIVEEVTRSGERWISLTQVNGRSVIRLMVISYLTGPDHLERLREALEAAAEKALSAR
jgi:hypothetical protein